MRRGITLIIALICALPLMLWAIIKIAYELPSDESVPAPVVEMFNRELLPNGYEWNVQVLSGFGFREFIKAPEDAVENIGLLTSSSLSMKVPESYRASISIYNQDGFMVFSGTTSELSSLVITENGNYSFTITLEKAATGPNDYGKLFYKGGFKVAIDADIEASSDTVNQGDVLAIRVFNLFEDEKVTAEIDSENINHEIKFVYDSDYSATAYISFNHNFPGGKYNVHVSAGQDEWDVAFSVVGDDEDYEKIYNVTQLDEEGNAIRHPNPGSVTNAALEEFNEKIVPLYTSDFDDEKHWSGSFLSPVSGGRTGATYGAFIYQDGQYSTRHAGVDLLAAEGTPVLCPAGGRVVLAEFLENTGNTIVIEHGGGLKSYLFHLQELSVTEGQMVERGRALGYVGMTGNVREAQLHYEVRIGNQTVNVSKLMSGSGGLFYFS